MEKIGPKPQEIASFPAKGLPIAGLQPQNRGPAIALPGGATAGEKSMVVIEVFSLSSDEGLLEGEKIGEYIGPVDLGAEIYIAEVAVGIQKLIYRVIAVVKSGTPHPIFGDGVAYLAHYVYVSDIPQRKTYVAAKNKILIPLAGAIRSFLPFGGGIALRFFFLLFLIAILGEAFGLSPNVRHCEHKEKDKEEPGLDLRFLTHTLQIYGSREE